MNSWSRWLNFTAVLFFQLLVIPQCFCDLYFYGPSIELLTRGSSPKRTEADILKNVYYQSEPSKVLNLADYAPTYNVLIPLLPGKSFANRTEALKHFKTFHQGKFLVEAPPGHGIIASLQVLRLHTGTGEANQCLDYVQFAELSNQDQQLPAVVRKSPKICGEDDVDDFNPQPARLTGPASFVATSGRMSVSILIFSTRINTAWKSPVGSTSHLEKLIAVEITFTAFPVLERLKALATPSVAGVHPSPELKSSYHGNLSAIETADLVRVGVTCPFQNIYNRVMNVSTRLLQCPSTSSEIYCIHEALFCDNSIQCAFDFNVSLFAIDELHCGNSGLMQKINLNVEEDPSASNLTFVNGTRRLNPKLIVAPKAPGFAYARLVVILSFVIFVIALLAGLWWGFRIILCGGEGEDDLKEIPLDDVLLESAAEQKGKKCQGELTV